MVTCEDVTANLKFDPWVENFCETYGQAWVEGFMAANGLGSMADRDSVEYRELERKALRAMVCVPNWGEVNVAGYKRAVKQNDGRDVETPSRPAGFMAHFGPEAKSLDDYDSGFRPTTIKELTETPHPAK